MNKLLVNYIKQYLKESALPYHAEDIDAGLQHKLSPKITKDMTNISEEDVLKILMQNLGDRTCISFVNEYNEDIPSFNINPHARYNTPHGNYAYPLTLENLRDIISIKKVKGASFAIERPYFLLFKVNSPNALVIDEDGKTNYKSLRSTRRAMSRGEVITLDQDINTIIRTFIYYIRTSNKPSPSLPKWRSFNSDSFNDQLPRYHALAEYELESLNNNQNRIETFIERFSDVLRDFMKNYLTLCNEVPNDIEKKFFNKTFKLLKKHLVELSGKKINKFHKGDDTDDFHKIYFICWLLSNIGEITSRKDSNGPILTLLLRSIGPDAIIDQGSSTLHNAEPEQTVSLSFGNVEAKDIEFLGTFENIFKKSEDYLEDLAAKIYKEEGYKYDIDFFSKNEKPNQSIARSTVYTYLEDLLMTYHTEDLILNRGLAISGNKLKVKFDFYADFMSANNSGDYEFAQIQEFIKLMYRAILKSPHKDYIEVDLGLSEFDYDVRIDLSASIKKLFEMQFFDTFVEDFSKGLIKLNSIESYSFLNYDQELLYFLKPMHTKLLVNKECSFTIIIKERYCLDEILSSSSHITIDKLASISFDLSNMELFRSKRTKNLSKQEEEKQKITQQINEKYPKAKVQI